MSLSNTDLSVEQSLEVEACFWRAALFGGEPKGDMATARGPRGRVIGAGCWRGENFEGREARGTRDGDGGLSGSCSQLAGVPRVEKGVEPQSREQDATSLQGIFIGASRR